MHRLARLILLLPFLAAPAAAEPVDIYGRTLDLVLPADTCALDYAQPVEQAMIDNMIQVNQGSNEVIAYFAPCDMLQALRDGQADWLPVSGTLLLPVVGGSFQASTLDRATFLAMMAKEIPSVDSAALAAMEQDINQRSSVGSIGETQFLGALGEDASAIYIGLLAVVTAPDGSVANMATVVALTQLADVPLSANLSREYASNADLDWLLAQLQAYMAELTARNP